VTELDEADWGAVLTANLKSVYLGCKHVLPEVPRYDRRRGALTQKQIKRGVHPSTRALEAAIRHYIAVTNEAPKPFVWTKTADEILASVARFCHRISETGH
jgi:hypothetical protein